MKEKPMIPIKRLVIYGVICACLLLLWVIPFKESAVSVSFLSSSTFENKSVEVTIVCKEAYRSSYTLKSTVKNGALTFLIPAEYEHFDRIAVTDADFAASVSGMTVHASAFSQGDYVSATHKGAVLEADGATFVMNDAAKQCVEKGRTHLWGGKLVITAVVLLVLLIVAYFRFMKKRIGLFKTVMLFVLFLLVVAVIAVCFAMQTFDMPAYVFRHGISNHTLMAAVIAVLAVLLGACIVVDKEGKNAMIWIVVIYVTAFLFAGGKMLFYSANVGRTPDEIAHIGYVAACEKSDRWLIPPEEVPMPRVIESDGETMHATFAGGTVNYLRHPPLYYQLVAACGGVEFQADGTYTVDVDAVRGVGMVLTLAALALMFYIGYTRLKKIPFVHLLFAVIAVSVPMFTYVASGVNNDTLTFLTVTVTFFGLIRYCEKKRDAATFLLIAVGVSASMLTKLTAGVIAVVAALIVLVSTLVCEKSLRELKRPVFLATLPLYLLAGAYYIYMLAEYGALQPSLDTLNEAYAQSTKLYPAADQRSVMGFTAYVGYFIGNIVHTWTGISSHLILLKPGGSVIMDFIGLTFLLFVPFFMLSKTIRRDLAHTKPIGAMGIAVIVTMVMQMLSGYSGMVQRGYFGGIQSRYYLCTIAMFALCTALLTQKILVNLQNKEKYADVVRNTMVVFITVFILVIAYEDFVFFLINNQQYV